MPVCRHYTRMRVYSWEMPWSWAHTSAQYPPWWPSHKFPRPTQIVRDSYLGPDWFFLVLHDFLEDGVEIGVLGPTAHDLPQTIYRLQQGKYNLGLVIVDNLLGRGIAYIILGGGSAMILYGPDPGLARLSVTVTLRIYVSPRLRL